MCVCVSCIADTCLHMTFHRNGSCLLEAQAGHSFPASQRRKRRFVPGSSHMGFLCVLYSHRLGALESLGGDTTTHRLTLSVLERVVHEFCSMSFSQASSSNHCSDRAQKAQQPEDCCCEVLYATPQVFWTGASWGQGSWTGAGQWEASFGFTCLRHCA